MFTMAWHSGMADMVFQGAELSSLRNVRELQCRIITKSVSDTMVRFKHPALLIWDREETFGQLKQIFCLIHLKKLPREYVQSDEAKGQGMGEQIEIECRSALIGDLKREKWNLTECKEQALNVQHGVVDIAHWCLKYEMLHRYEYRKYSSNCRLFMVALCKAFELEHDDKDWTDSVCFIVKKTSGVCGGCRSRG